MGSSGSSDFTQPTSPSPPAGSINPMGTAAAPNHQWINFLGDTNTPSTGLTPEMLSAIMATQNPAPGPAPPPAAAAAPAAPVKRGRDQLAGAMSRGGGEGGAGSRGAGSGGNGGGWGGH